MKVLKHEGTKWKKPQTFKSQKCTLVYKKNKSYLKFIESIKVMKFDVKNEIEAEVHSQSDFKLDF